MHSKNFFRVMLGRNGIYNEMCLRGGFVGVDFGIQLDLSQELSLDLKQFNKKFVPIYLAEHPEKSKVGAALACSFLWTFAKEIKSGDVVLCPNGEGAYLIGEVISDYFYQPGESLPHRKSVKWLNRKIQRSDMSENLKKTAGATGTVRDLSKYSIELDILIFDKNSPHTIVTDTDVEDPFTFALEKHLEEFLIKNWNNTNFGKHYNIYEEDGEVVGQQYPTDTGPIDILAVSKDNKELLVIELKKGRAGDAVVGQILRYMSFVQEEIAEEAQTVRGVIIASQGDLRIHRALRLTKNIEFYQYQVSFKLLKV